MIFQVHNIKFKKWREESKLDIKKNRTREKYRQKTQELNTNMFNIT